MKLNIKDGKYYPSPEGGWDKEEIDWNKCARQANNYHSNFLTAEWSSLEIREALSKMMSSKEAL